jgi:hypothetical protein
MSLSQVWDRVTKYFILHVLLHALGSKPKRLWQHELITIASYKLSLGLNKGTNHY